MNKGEHEKLEIGFRCLTHNLLNVEAGQLLLDPLAHAENVRAHRDVGAHTTEYIKTRWKPFRIGTGGKVTARDDMACYRVLDPLEDAIAGVHTFS